MGTTESVLLGGDDDSNDSDGGSEPPTEPLSMPSGAEPPAPPPPRHRRARPHSSDADPVSSGQSLPLCSLQGIVLGLAKSGKRTLLDRLRGRNPPNLSAPAEAAETPPRAAATTVTPYKAPARTWDRIQLQVGLELPPETPVDFAVLLVHPRHPRKRVEKHLRQSLRALLERQGYVRDIPDGVSGSNSGGRKSRHGHGGAYPISNPTATATAGPRPLCLCLLIGHRDLLGPGADAETELEDLSGALTGTAMTVLQDFPLLEPDRLVLASGNVSLYDCFGLQRLHHFIYQAYLQRKRSDLEAQLREVHAARRVGVLQVEDWTYQDYVEKVVQAASGTHLRNGIANPTNPSPAETNYRRQIIAPNLSKQGKALEEEPESGTLAVDSKAALEAFLASSDSEDEETGVPRQTDSAEDYSGYEDEQEAEDNDNAFYYQETVVTKGETPVQVLGSHDDETELQSTIGNSSGLENSAEMADQTMDTDCEPRLYEDSGIEPSSTADDHIESVEGASALDSGEPTETKSETHTFQVASTELSGDRDIDSSPDISSHRLGEAKQSTNVTADESKTHTVLVESSKRRDEASTIIGNNYRHNDNGFIDTRKPTEESDSDEDDDFVIETDESLATPAQGFSNGLHITGQPINGTETVNTGTLNDEVKETLAVAKREMEQLMMESQPTAATNVERRHS